MTKIEWCDETLNPLGHWCFGPGGTKDNPKPCVYCYARKMAQRGMNGCEKCKSFNVPHTHFEQLDKLTAWRKPRNIFMQSMGDLFHDEVPDDWIRQVLDACKKAPQHRYIFLTKNYRRYNKLREKEILPLDKNMYFGASVTIEKELKQACLFYNNIDFLSIEPLMGYLGVDEWFVDINLKPVWKWVIVGAETGNRKGKIIPEFDWVEDIVYQCGKMKIPLFMKNSLAGIWNEPLIQEYPWREN